MSTAPQQQPAPPPRAQQALALVVTGGSSGVGGALVRRLLAAGHEVWLLDVKPPADGDNRARFIATDLANPLDLDAALQALPERIDGLANVAGIARAADPLRVLAVNFLGLRALSTALQGRLRPGGAIVSVSSIAGRDWAPRIDKLRPLLATRDFADGMAWCAAQRDWLAKDPYSWSKRCVTAWTLSEAQRAVHGRFRINCVSPGVIETPLSPEFTAMMGADHDAWSRAQTGRAATPEDIAEVLDWLVSRPPVWLNGVDVPVDGGYSAGVETGWVDLDNSPMVARIRAARDR